AQANADEVKNVLVTVTFFTSSAFAWAVARAKSVTPASVETTRSIVISIGLTKRRTPSIGGATWDWNWPGGLLRLAELEPRVPLDPREHHFDQGELAFGYGVQPAPERGADLRSPLDRFPVAPESPRERGGVGPRRDRQPGGLLPAHCPAFRAFVHDV